MRKSTLALAALVAMASQAPLAGAAGQHAAQWYVLRQPESFQCWPAVVIRVNGQAATGSALIAGGPFDSKDKAEQRITDLAQRGTCRSG